MPNNNAIIDSDITVNTAVITNNNLPNNTVCANANILSYLCILVDDCCRVNKRFGLLNEKMIPHFR